MKLQKTISHLFSTISLGLIYSTTVNAAPSVTVEYQGNNYTITSLTSSYNNNISLFQSQPWWGNGDLARGLAGLVKTDAGFYWPSATTGFPGGALFLFGTTPNSRLDLAYWLDPNVQDCLDCTTYNQTYNHAVLISMSPIYALTIASIAESLNSSSSGLNAVTSTTNLMVSGAHSRPMSRRVAVGEKTAWVAGDIGRDDHDRKTGSLGMAEIGGGYNFGIAQVNVSVGHTWTKQDLAFGGNVDADGEYLMLESIIPVSEANRVYATVGGFGHWGETDIRRGYLNGGNLQTSTASPDTRTWGVRARLDWENAIKAKSVEFSPYVDVNYYNSYMKSYTETGGGLPARFDSRKDERTDATIGLNAAMPIAGTKLNIVANVGAVHSFNDRGVRTSGQVVGLFGFNIDGDKQESNWVRAGAGVEGIVGKGKASVMLNGTTEGQMSNLWLAASYQMNF